MFNEIKKQLRGLNEKELEAIRDNCEYLLAHKKNFKPEPVTEFNYMFYMVLSTQVKNHGISKFTDIDQLEIKNTKLFNAYIEKSNEIKDWIDEHFSDLEPNRLNDLYKLLCRIYIRYLLSWAKDINMHLILSSLDKVPHLFDQQFPAYISNGLQYMIFRDNKEK